MSDVTHRLGDELAQRLRAWWEGVGLERWEDLGSSGWDKSKSSCRILRPGANCSLIPEGLVGPAGKSVSRVSDGAGVFIHRRGYLSASTRGYGDVYQLVCEVWLRSQTEHLQ